ncbi:hypothetical protein [Myxosarcina sp. GI1]|uniref:hypothetical protein n=1 Tax=Myxosarcina sp. GI1 TaxID=1541065 RepID=UPI000569F207|nr:hypothetical protein [Myxosarcina sp. GI1]
MFSWFDELKASVEAGIASGIEAGFKTLAESFDNRMGEWSKVPEPAEPYRLIRIFRPATDRTITQDNITIEQDSWKIVSYGEKKVLLFEIPEPEISECLLMCQAKVKTANLLKPAKLVLSVKNTGGWGYEYCSGIKGTTAWHISTLPFHYKKERYSGSITVSVEFESVGVFWLKDVEILQAAVKPVDNN